MTTFLSILLITFAEPSVAQDAFESDVKSDLRSIADRVDRLLGGRRTDDNRSESTLRLSAGGQVAAHQKPDHSFGANFNLKLATLQRWQRQAQTWAQKEWHSFEQDLSDPPPRDSGSPTKTPSQSTSLKPPPKDPWRFSVDKRISVGRTLRLGAWTRARKDWETQQVLYSFYQQFGWSMSDRWQSTTGLSLHLQNHSRLLTTWINALSYSPGQGEAITVTGPQLSYLLHAKHAITSSVTVSSRWAQHRYGISSYDGVIGYRFNTLDNWLFTSLTGFATAARATEFRVDPGVAVLVEAIL